MPRCDRHVDGRARAHRHRAARYEPLVHQGEVSQRERRCRSVVARNDSCSSTRDARIPERRQRRTRDAGTAPRVVRLPHRCAKNAQIKLLLVVFIAVPRLLIDETVAPPSSLHQVDCPPVRPISQAACHARLHRRLRVARRAGSAGTCGFRFRNVSRQRVAAGGDHRLTRSNPAEGRATPCAAAHVWATERLFQS